MSWWTFAGCPEYQMPWYGERVAETSNEILSIALDATLWDEPTTGLGIYTPNLSRSLENEGVRVTKVGLGNRENSPDRPGGATVYFLGALPRLLATLDSSLFHGVRNFTLPLLPIPDKAMVLTVHDIVSELLPDTVSSAFRWQSRLWLTRSLRVAQQIICDGRRLLTSCIRSRGRGPPGQLSRLTQSR